MKSFILTASILSVLGAAQAHEHQKLPPPCQSQIYCEGDLLHTVQMAKLFADSKIYVDMKLKYPRETTMALFEEMMIRTSNKPVQDELRKFVSDTFDEVGDELEPWDPPDFSQSPLIVDAIRDPAYKSWGSDLNDVWKVLARRVKDDVYENSDLYSIIYVPNPVIVPGGRFRELYYWDTYWIVNGLILSEMHSTAGVIDNMVSLVKRFGFIPNGSRKYYLNRSQPPLLTAMVDSYVKATGDWNFLDKNKYLESEFGYWMENHTVSVEKNGKSYTLARYFDQSSGPRPESYREDYHSADIFQTDAEKDDFYSEIKTAAESGWDFSSRWFVKDGQNKGNLSDIAIPQIIPVDLNAFVQANAKILSNWFSEMGNQAKKTYATIADQWLEAVREVLWYEEVGTWLDYDMINNIKREYFYPSNVAPLWTGCFEQEKKDYSLDHVLGYLKSGQITQNVGGIPTSLEATGEQWDYPNAWPPLQHMVIQGLDASGNVDAKELAFEMAERWVHSNYKAFNSTAAMFEKYDATVAGGHGGGGEYEVQFGFGWSNGVIMELLAKYGDRLSVSEILKLDSLVSTPSTIQKASFFNIFLAQLRSAATCIGAALFLKRYTPRAKYTRIPSSPELKSCTPPNPVNGVIYPIMHFSLFVF
uniref:Trehalase n=1 Tax=Apolygus lucorum TaxID=248454 RepID=U3LTJ0_APOLU|nr:soluble trehalase [Apolygus lucorum]